MGSTPTAGDDLRAGRAEHNHVRKWLDRPIRLRRRVDHHRRRRVDRHSRRLGAGRAGRRRRARDAERRRGDDDGERLARGVRKRGRLARDPRRRERPEHRWRRLDRTLRLGRRRHQCDGTDHDLDLGNDLDHNGPQRLRRQRRRRGFGKSISPPRRSRRPARARSDFTPATSRRPAAAALLRCRDN